MSCPRCPNPTPRRRSFFRRSAGGTGWLLPSILLVLMPKCPLCLAAYITVATGIGMSFATAAWLRGSLIGLCVGVIIIKLILLWKNSYSSSAKS